jgi:hypothetical protein
MTQGLRDGLGFCWTSQVILFSLSLTLPGGAADPKYTMPMEMQFNQFHKTLFSQMKIEEMAQASVELLVSLNLAKQKPILVHNGEGWSKNILHAISWRGQKLEA